MRFQISAAMLITLIVASGCSDESGPQLPANDPPVIELLSDTSAVLGDTLTLWAVAEDPNGDPLTYHVTAHLTLSEIKQLYWPNVRINKETGYFWFKPSERDKPNRRFTVWAEDGRGGADSTTFSVTVN